MSNTTADASEKWAQDPADPALFFLSLLIGSIAFGVLVILVSRYCARRRAQHHQVTPDPASSKVLRSDDVFMTLSTVDTDDEVPELKTPTRELEIEELLGISTDSQGRPTVSSV